ncbi:MAG: RecX family transcriptional regulator [Saprospiraceae bacterium]|nr:RecX family transcriptional regulator [Saprospiraceae bacterium]
MTKEIALNKIKKYCAYQDRSHFEVRSKLLTLEVFGQDLEDIMLTLIQENYLNEERFAKSFIRGKFRMKRWGRQKIKQALYQHQISEYCMKLGMKEIDEQEYLEVLESILKDKFQKALQKHNPLLAKDAAIKYASNRGFEPAIIFKIIKELELSSDTLF